MHGSLKRWFFLSTLILTSAAHTVGKEIAAINDVSEDDIQALREWINTKRQVTIKELGGALSISGDIHAELQSTNERVNGVKQRGRGAPLLSDDGKEVFPNQAYDIEFNLLLDYRTDRTWSAVRIKFDNDAGVFHNTNNRVKIDRAYFGLRLVDGERFTIDVEVGRRSMSNVFDSKVEFNSNFDGIVFKYDQGFEQIADVYFHGGVFIVNERRDQYGYVAEIGMFNMGTTPWYAKYSVVDWDTKDYHNTVINERFHFIVNQWKVGYKFIPTSIGKVVDIYLAGLYNPRARKLAITDYKRANFGGYFGFAMGELKKKGDWSVEADYQVVAAQVVPDFDSNGIGLGNANRSGFYTKNVNNLRGNVPALLNTRSTAGGNVNFRGYEITVQYLFTPYLNLFQQWQDSMTLDHDIGPFRRFKQYEVDFIYLF